MSGAGFCAIVPAAGAGTRLGGGRSKPLRPVAGAATIAWAVAPLLRHRDLERLIVAVAPEAHQGLASAGLDDERIQFVNGGDTRPASVRAGLAALADEPRDRTIVVHDGARPCLSDDDAARVVTAAGDPDGALLAVPVRDTLKRADGAGRVDTTLSRESVWQALTPQGAPRAVLAQALAEGGEGVTDEASALEALGCAPRLIEGEPTNIKVTRPGDLWLAEAILQASAGRSGESVH